MTLREQIAAAKAAKLAAQPQPASGGSLREQIAAAKAAKQAQQPAPAPVTEEDDGPNWLGRANAALQGATLGMADEFGTALASGAVRLGDMTGLTDTGSESWGEVYHDMMGSEQAKRDAYAEANPIENLALNVAGGVATGGTTMAKAIPSALKGAKALAARTAVGAGEGAIAGGASAREGERLEGAKTGALVGGLAAPAMSAIGSGARGLSRALSKRRVDRNLGKGEDFTPLNIADPEGGLGEFYRNTIGRSYGGGKVTQQSQKVMHGLEREMGANTEKLNLAAYKSSLPSTVGGDSLGDLPVTNPTKAFERVKQAWDRDGFKAVKGIDFDIDEAELLDEVIDAVDDPAMRDNAGELIDVLNRKIGKTMVRDKVMPEGAKFKGDGYGGVKAVEPVDASHGKISGEDLIEARNWFRRKINASDPTGEGKLRNAAYGKAAAAIDRRIRKQLGDADPALLKSYEDDIAGYGKYMNLEKAASAAGKTEGELMTPRQLLTAATGGRKTQTALGEAPHQQLARDALRDEVKLKLATRDAKRGAPPAIGGVQKIVQTGILGFLPSGGVAPLAVPAGYATAKAASPQITQRVLAGQTAPQEAVAKALRAYDGSNTQEILNALGTGARRGTITDTTD